MFRNRFIITLWSSAYEDTAPETVSKEEHEKAIAAATKKHEELLAEIETLRTKSNLTAQERADLEKRLEDLKGQSQTVEQKLQKELEKLNKTYANERTTLEQQANSWRSRYQNSVIDTSLRTAALAGEAHNPAQILALLRPNTELVEVLGEDGKPTGDFAPIVTIKSIDPKTKKPVDLKLTPEDAIKYMKEDEGHANLFKGVGVSGRGGQNGKSAKLDLKELAKDPVEYRKARKEGAVL